MRSILLIDGEHYPPVTARAVEGLRAQGEEPVLALLAGGREKLGAVFPEIGVPVEFPSDPEAALAEAIERTGAKLVTDLSDEPVLGYVRRCRLASVALWKEAVYRGPGFEFRPPERAGVPWAPSIAVVGTGKRTGKTAIGAALARTLSEAGHKPVVVAMGRGGPPEPEVIPGGMELTPQLLLEWAGRGRHAASDYIEDALMSGVASVGSWRAGGGLAGATGFSNYEEALGVAAKLDPGIMVLEGSGAAIPPARWDCGILVVDARIDPGHLCGYFGLYRRLLTGTVVLTMCEETLDAGHLASVERCIRSGPGDMPKLMHTVFRPYPLQNLSGKRIWLATTAPPEASGLLTRHLQEAHGAQVMGISHELGNRPALARDLEGAGGAEVIAVELKAAAVDVVVRVAAQRGQQVCFVDNRPVAVAGDAPIGELFLDVATEARSRFESRMRTLG